MTSACEKCGVRREDSKIVDGQDASVSEYPWMVFLLIIQGIITVFSKFILVIKFPKEIGWELVVALFSTAGGWYVIVPFDSFMI